MKRQADRLLPEVYGARSGPFGGVDRIPAISTGAFGYPSDLAAQVAFTTLTDELREQTLPMSVQLCAFDGQTFRALTSWMAADNL